MDRAFKEHVVEIERMRGDRIDHDRRLFTFARVARPAGSPAAAIGLERETGDRLRKSRRGDTERIDDGATDQRTHRGIAAVAGADGSAKTLGENGWHAITAPKVNL